MYAELWKNIKNDQKLFWYDGESEENPNPKPWILATQPITRADAVIKTFQFYLSNTLFFIKKISQFLPNLDLPPYILFNNIFWYIDGTCKFWLLT